MKIKNLGISKFILSLTLAFTLFLGVFFSVVSPVNAEEVDDTWLNKKYERICMFSSPNILSTEFDNINYKTTYSQISQVSGSSNKVVFNPDSITFYAYTSIEGNQLNSIYARIDDKNDYISIHYDFSNVDVIRLVYYSGHNNLACGQDTHSIGEAKTLEIHVFKSFTGNELTFTYSFFPEACCIDNIQLFTESNNGSSTVGKSGDLYYKDLANRYEFYSYAGFNTDGSGSSSGDSSSLIDSFSTSSDISSSLIDSSSTSSDISSSSSDSSSSGSGGSPTGPDVVKPLEINFFDGSVDTVVPEKSGSKSYYNDLLTVEWFGIGGGGTDIPYSTFVNGKYYYLAWRTGGSSNSTRYIKFKLNEKVINCQVYIVLAPNSSKSADINIGGDTFFKTGTDKNVYTSVLSSKLGPGEYELAFTDSIRIAEISFSITHEPDNPDEDTGKDYIVVNNVIFCYVDDNGIQRHKWVDIQEYASYSELYRPEDVTEGKFMGWYEDNGIYKNEFTFDEFKNYFSDITEDKPIRAKAVYARILNKNGENVRIPDLNLDKDPTNASEEVGNGESQIKCKHDFDFWKPFGFPCKKCGITFWAYLWQSVKYWVFGILGVILALIMVKIGLKLANKG